MARALICIDLINDMVGEGGKLAGKGYKVFADEHATVKAVAALQERCRQGGVPVIHVRVGFDPEYLNHPASSPLFGTAAQFGALRMGAWGTEFMDGIGPREGELVVHKPRVSAFYNTALESALRALDVQNVLLSGVATDLAVQAAARDAHDRDMSVTVVADACAAATEEDQATSLVTLAKIARIASSDEIE